jgi:hypothetical protein
MPTDALKNKEKQFSFRLRKEKRIIVIKNPSGIKIATLEYKLIRNQKFTVFINSAALAEYKLLIKGT